MANNFYETQQDLLKNGYEKLFDKINERPEWAVKRLDNNEVIHPTIPFVGKNYGNIEKKLLLYASAENLTNYDGWIDETEKAINRHRFWFDNYSKDKFFPNVHIAPINDGALVIAVAYILRLLKIEYEYSAPRELLENISFANFSKFTINAKKNVDPAKYPITLASSSNYIEKDLEILKPDIIVMPKSIYKHLKIKKLIKSILPDSLVIPIYQINSRVINGTINIKYSQKNPADIGKLAEWQSHLSNGITSKTNQNFYAVYTYLEEVIKSLIVQ